MGALLTLRMLEPPARCGARPAAQGFEGRSLGAGEHPAPDQLAVCAVEGVAIGTAGRATAEASLVEVLDHGRMGQGMVALEPEKVVAPAFQNPLRNRGLAPHGSVMHGSAGWC